MKLNKIQVLTFALFFTLIIIYYCIFISIDSFDYETANTLKYIVCWSGIIDLIFIRFLDRIY